MICRGPSVLADGIDVGDDEVTALVEDEKSSKVSRSVAGDGDGCCFRSSPGSGRLCDLESALPRANEAAAHPASLDEGATPLRPSELLSSSSRPRRWELLSCERAGSDSQGIVASAPP